MNNRFTPVMGRPQGHRPQGQACFVGLVGYAMLNYNHQAAKRTPLLFLRLKFPGNMNHNDFRVHSTMGMLSIMAELSNRDAMTRENTMAYSGFKSEMPSRRRGMRRRRRTRNTLRSRRRVNEDGALIWNWNYSFVACALGWALS